MPLTIRMTDLSLPQAWILEDASPNNDGVMSAVQAAQLAALVAGGGAIVGPWVLWDDLGFPNGFASGIAPLGPARSRTQGDGVLLSGVVITPNGGTGGNFHITTLPVGQIPSKVRYCPTSWQPSPTPATSSTAIAIGIDDIVGSFTGTPGAVFVADNIATSLSLLLLDGLSFVL